MNPAIKPSQQPDPRIGMPPSLEQVPVARPRVDRAYQHAAVGPASRRIIDDLVKRRDRALAQPLMAARRTDVSFWTLDGQHRQAGAAAHGDIPFLPCVIPSALDLADEARKFVDLNSRHQRLTRSGVLFLHEGGRRCLCRSGAATAG